MGKKRKPKVTYAGFKKKKVKGRRYIRIDKPRTKKGAQKEAADIRKNGYTARVVKEQNRHFVYIGPKKKASKTKKRAGPKKPKKRKTKKKTVGPFGILI